MSDIHIGSRSVSYTHCLRVTLLLAHDKVEVLDVRRVAMRAPAAPPAAPTTTSSGTWFDVRDGDGQLLYYRPLAHTHLDSLEVFDDPKSGSIRRVPVASRERKVDLIIPEIQGAEKFTLYGPRARTERMAPSDVLHQRSMAELRGMVKGGAR